MGTFNDPNHVCFFHLYDDSGAFYGIPAEGRVYSQDTDCVLGNVFLGSSSDWKSKINRYVCGTACLFCNTGMAVFLGKMHALKV